jgi:predicted DNA-binding transcriptional regulator YafY
MTDPRKIVTIDYTNWRGERAMRRIIPLGVVFANNEWHPETQWLLESIDVDTGKFRCFALANIHSRWSGTDTPRRGDRA